MPVRFDELKSQLTQSFKDVGLTIEIVSIEQKCDLSAARQNVKTSESDDDRFVTVNFDMGGMTYGQFMTEDYDPISIFAKIANADGIPRSISTFTARASTDGPYSVSFIPDKLAA